MIRRGAPLLIAFVVALSASTNDGSTGSPSSTSVVVSGSTNPLVESGRTTEATSVDGSTSAVSEGTLALPPGSSADVVVTTFRDSDNHRCIEVGSPLGARQGVCYDDAPDGLTYVTHPDESGGVYVFGGIELAEAVRLVAVMPDGDQVAIPMVAIDQWPERAFVALFDVPPTRLEATDASGQVIATATN